MKKLLKISFAFLLVLGFASCEEDNDTLTGGAATGGLLSVETVALSYIQGSDPVTDLFYADLSVFQGREKVESVEVFKQFYREVDATTTLMSNNALLKTVSFPVVGQQESLQFSFNYNELISDVVFEGSPLSADDADLLIGDYWKVTYVAHLTDGTTQHLNLGNTTVTVSCGSFLSGDYRNVTTRVDNGTVYTYTNDIVTKVGDGTYTTTYIGNYYCTGQTPGDSGNTFNLPAGTSAGYTFTDVCTVIGLGTQNLASVYSNEVRQSAAQKANSFVNPVTGVITIYYSVFFTSNTVEREFITVLTPN